MIASAARASSQHWLSRQFTNREPDITRIVARVRQEPARIDALLEGLTSSRPPVKFGSAKALWLLADAVPELLYPHFDRVLSLLDDGNNILRWNAIRVLACLAPADTAGKLEKALEKYLSPIAGPELIAAANAIQWAPRIALAKPHLADRLAQAILGVQRANYKTAECRNVAIGHAILSLGQFLDLIRDKHAVVAFVAAQLDNPRAATRKKASAFLKKNSTARSAAPGDRS